MKNTLLTFFLIKKNVWFFSTKSGKKKNEADQPGPSSQSAFPNFNSDVCFLCQKGEIVKDDLDLTVGPSVKNELMEFFANRDDFQSLEIKARIADVDLVEAGAQYHEDCIKVLSPEILHIIRVEKVRYVAALIRRDMCTQLSPMRVPKGKDFMDGAENDVPELLTILLEEIILPGKEKSCIPSWKKNITAIGHVIMKVARPKCFLSKVLLGIGAFLSTNFASRLLIHALAAIGFSSCYSEIQLLNLDSFSKKKPQVVTNEFLKWVPDGAFPCSDNCNNCGREGDNSNVSIHEVDTFVNDAGNDDQIDALDMLELEMTGHLSDENDESESSDDEPLENKLRRLQASVEDNESESSDDESLEKRLRHLQTSVKDNKGDSSDDEPLEARLQRLQTEKNNKSESSDDEPLEKKLRRFENK